MHRALIQAALLTAPIIAHVPGPGVSSAQPTTTNASTLGAPALFALAPVASPQPGATRGKKVAIETDDGLELAATYFPPKGSGRAPAALLLHDAGADRGQFEELAPRLQKRGFGVLTLDLRGHGDSRSERADWAKAPADDRAKMWQTAPRDVEAAAEWLLSQRDIHSTNLSVLGVGAGCALAVRHAENDENVRCLTLLSPHAEDYGFDVESGIIDLQGLATCVIAPRDAEAEKLAERANQSAPQPWIQWIAISASAKSALEDRKAPAKIASWMGDVALPKKGRDR